MKNREDWEAEKIASARSVNAVILTGGGKRTRGPDRIVGKDGDLADCILLAREDKKVLEIGAAQGRKELVYAVRAEGYSIQITEDFTL